MPDGPAGPAAGVQPARAASIRTPAEAVRARTAPSLRVLDTVHSVDSHVGGLHARDDNTADLEAELIDGFARDQ
ncbi:hypothetical protein ACFPRL_05355 [Pseudoclavibacter helvolus]